ncbi:hypothetical protein KIPB_011954, partial [Kipferlia bialata]|eukprot:g11954.t1
MSTQYKEGGATADLSNAGFGIQSLAWSENGDFCAVATDEEVFCIEVLLSKKDKVQPICARRSQTLHLPGVLSLTVAPDHYVTPHNRRRRSQRGVVAATCRYLGWPLHLLYTKQITQANKGEPGTLLAPPTILPFEGLDQKQLLKQVYQSRKAEAEARDQDDPDNCDVDALRRFYTHK